jgi:hypothetical protein
MRISLLRPLQTAVRSGSCNRDQIEEIHEFSRQDVSAQPRLASNLKPLWRQGKPKAPLNAPRPHVTAFVESLSMNKRSFLKPLAFAIGALVGTLPAQAATSQDGTTVTGEAIGKGASASDNTRFVISDADGQVYNDRAEHVSHSSHSSHSSSSDPAPYPSSSPTSEPTDSPSHGSHSSHASHSSHSSHVSGS